MKRLSAVSSLLVAKNEKRVAHVVLEPVVEGYVRQGFVGNPLALRGLFLS